MKVVINHNLTYETDLDLSIGDTVVLPTASYLRDVQGDTFEGKVTALESDYDGYCVKVIRKVN
jgi:hypothetical protein